MWIDIYRKLYPHLVVKRNSLFFASAVLFQSLSLVIDSINGWERWVCDREDVQTTIYPWRYAWQTLVELKIIDRVKLLFINYHLSTFPGWLCNWSTKDLYFKSDAIKIIININKCRNFLSNSSCVGLEKYYFSFEIIFWLWIFLKVFLSIELSLSDVNS